MVTSPTSSALNLAALGTGKTLMTVEVAKRIVATQILLIAPLGTRLGWQRTFTQQGVDLPFYWINSTKAGKDAFDFYHFGEPGIFMVGVELFTRWSWNGRKRTTKWSTQYPDMVIFDEAHRAQNRTSKTFKALMAVDGGYRMAVSATMAGNRWEGAWATARWAFPDHVATSYWDWVTPYAATVYDRFAFRNQKVVGEKNPGAFYASLPCVVRLEPPEDIEVVYEDVFVDMLPTQRKIYDQFEKDLVVFLGENPLVATVPVVHRIRLRQIALGVPTVDEEGSVTFDPECKSAKLDAMFDVLEDQFEGEPALIGTHSAKFAVVTAHRLRAKGYRIGLWVGDATQTEREDMKVAFVNGELDYVVATIPALAEGVDQFQLGTRNVLLLSRSENRALVEQFIGRVARQGQSRTVRVVEVKSIGTADEDVFSAQVRAELAMRKSLAGASI